MTDTDTSGNRTWRPLAGRVVLAALVLAASTAQAAPDKPANAAKAQRDRQALQQAQAALQQAQAALQQTQGERDAANAARSAAEGQRTAAAAQAARLKAESAKLRSELDEARAALARLQTERDTLQREAAAAAEAAAARDAQQQQALASTRAELAGRTQTVTALVALLEKSTGALAAAEAANARLLALGQDAVRRYQARTPEEATAIQDPVLGLRAVTIDNTAERLRAELDRHRVIR